MYDINGKEVYAYDVNGKPFGHSYIHHTLSYTLPTGYNGKAYINDSYNGFKAAFMANPKAIPFFVVTDQHGVSLGLLRYVNNLDVSDKINFIKFQLGDYCYDYFTTSAMNGLLKNSKDVDGYLSCPGNHDYKNSVSEFDSDVLKASFTQDVAWYGCRWMSSQYKCYTAVDKNRNLKIIMSDPYDSRGFISGMAHPWYNEEFTDWLISEFTNDNGYDLLFVQHEPFFLKYMGRNSTSETDYSNETAQFIRPLIVARKKKQSGTFTDKEGVVHSYDFSNCNGELLMALHGHTHAELFDTTDLTSYTCRNGYAGTFGLIDRQNKKLKVWVFSYDVIYDEFEIPLL